MCQLVCEDSELLCFILCVFKLTTFSYFYSFIGQFTVPSVSGQCCPPTSSFTIDKINQNKGIMFGGAIKLPDGCISANGLYIFHVTHSTIVSYYLSYRIIALLFSNLNWHYINFSVFEILSDLLLL